jgi:hypothetical protein
MASTFYRRTSHALSLFALLCLSLGFAACATTRQTRSVEPSGFLGDYSELREGTGDEAQLVYIDRVADFSSYHAVLIDSVTLWHESDPSKIPAEEGQALTEYLYSALHKELGEDYRMVDSPGPGVMRIRAAITETKGAKVVANVVTTVPPQLRNLTTLAGRASDTQLFVGRCGLEAEITDSMTGERLMAAVDRRAGTKTLSGMTGKWSDVEEAFDFWTEQLRKRLETLRARQAKAE